MIFGVCVRFAGSAPTPDLKNRTIILHGTHGYPWEQDVAERNDLAYRHPDVLARLKTLLADWEAELARTPAPSVVR